MGWTQIESVLEQNLMRIFWPKSKHVTGNWKHCIKSFSWFVTYRLSFMKIKLQRMNWAGHVARMGIWEMQRAYKISARKSDVKRPLDSPGRQLEDNIKISLKVTGWVYSGFNCLTTVISCTCMTLTSLIRKVTDYGWVIGIWFSARTEILFAIPPRQHLGPTQPPWQCIAGVILLEYDDWKVKLTSAAPDAWFKNAWSVTSI
jgi:hypothetical protein